MSFWSKIGGLFTGDTYFPDNPAREHRAKELAQDCADLYGKCSVLAPAIKSELQKLNGAIGSLCPNPSELPAEAKVNRIAVNQYIYDAAQIITPLIVSGAVTSALEVAATSYLVSVGEIGTAALVELVGLPLAFEVGIGAAAGVAVIGISFAIGAIAGAEMRTELRKAIHEGAGSRIQLEKAYLVNYQLHQSIVVMLSVISSIRDTLGEDRTTADITPIMNKIKEAVSATSAELDSIADQDAIQALAALDRARRSWTNEG